MFRPHPKATRSADPTSLPLFDRLEPRRLMAAYAVTDLGEPRGARRPRGI